MTHLPVDPSGTLTDRWARRKGASVTSPALRNYVGVSVLGAQRSQNGDSDDRCTVRRHSL